MKRVQYEKFLEHRELDRRAIILTKMYDSLSTKSSVKWILTGLNEAQIHRESSGEQAAVSPKGALGIAQFMPDTWDKLIKRKMIPEWFSIDDMSHQRMAQLIYLNYLYSIWTQMPDDRKALTIASYNAGPGRIKKIVEKYGSDWKNNLPVETSNYLNDLKSYI